MIKVICETASYMVVFKPAGMPVETKAFGHRSLETELLRYLQEKAAAVGKNAEKLPYLAVINRLDQPVEGLVLFAKHAKAAAYLSAELQNHTLSKDYLAVTTIQPDREASNPDSKEIELTDYLVRDGRTNMTKVVPKGTAKAKKAVLYYQVLDTRPDGQRLLQIRLVTGRHHQIRVQLAHAGMPICGDRKYGGAAAGETGRSFPALCAWRLTFPDPDTGEKISVKTQPENPMFQIFTLS